MGRNIKHAKKLIKKYDEEQVQRGLQKSADVKKPVLEQ